MIPDIAEINFPVDENGKQYATLHQAVVSFETMGERTINTQVRIDGDIVPDFTGWQLEFRGERFVLPTMEPQAVKDNTTRNSLVDLTFISWPIQEMKRYFFMEMTAYNSGTAIANRYVASVGLSIKNFVILFNRVLKYYFDDKITMDLYMADSDIYSNDVVYVDINYSHIWDVLLKFYEAYGTKWFIKRTNVPGLNEYIIYVNYPQESIDDHDFEYGYQGGLIRFERQVPDDDIVNILLGRGGTKNLPYRYFKRTDPENPTFEGDPDAINELSTVYFDRLLDSNFRSYIQGWLTNKLCEVDSVQQPKRYWERRGEVDFAYRFAHFDKKFMPVEYVKDDDSIAKYGEHWGALDDNDDIFPTIQGVSIAGIGRVDEVVGVSPIVTDDIQAGTYAAASEIDIEGVMKTSHIEPNSRFETDVRGVDFVVPEGLSANFERVGSWVGKITKGFSRYGERARRIGAYAIPPNDPINQQITINTALSKITVYNKLTGEEVPQSAIPAGEYYYTLHIVIDSVYESGTYEYVDFTYGVNGMRLSPGSANINVWKPTFEIWIKNIWSSEQEEEETDEEYATRVWTPILGDHLGGEAKVAFSDGFMSGAGYEFPLAAWPVVDRTVSREGFQSEWRLTLSKSDAEFDATGLFIPNATTGGSPVPGDHFYFLGVELPHQYVLWAEEKLTQYKLAQLENLKQVNPTWVVAFDKVRINSLEEGEYEKTLAERLEAGAIIKTKDKRFTNGETLSLYVNSITYTWNEPSVGAPYIVPDVEVVLSEKIIPSNGTMSRISGEIENIKATYTKTDDLEKAIRSVADPLFLKKTGESDTSASPTTFASKISSLNFRKGGVDGRGWGIYEDSSQKYQPAVSEDYTDYSPEEEEGEGSVDAGTQNSLLLSKSPASYRLLADAGQEESQGESQTEIQPSSVLEIDKLIVRKEMQVNSLVINQISAVGGKEITSAAAIVCTNVIENADSYTCYFDQKQGSVANLFKVNDIAFGQVFDANDAELRYYKMVVSAIDVDSITLSKANRDGIGSPMAGDTIVQFGNTTDPTRQYVIVKDVIGGGYERMLSGLTIDEEGNFTTGEEYFFAGRQTGETERLFIGDANGRYLEYKNNELTINARLTVQSEFENSDGSYSSLGAYIEGLDYLKEAFKESTVIQGGLILSSLIQLGQTEEDDNFHVYSGINGKMSSGRGGGIAAWFGGPMNDMGDPNPEILETASTLFRFDGSGYLANNNIYWAADGAGAIPGVSWTSDGKVVLSNDIYLEGGDAQIISLIEAANKFNSLFDIDQNGAVYVKNNRGFYSNSFVSAFGKSSTPGGGGGQGGATSLYALDEVSATTSPSADDLFFFNGEQWTNVSKSELLSDYALSASIPTDTGDLTNGAGFVTLSTMGGPYQPLNGNLTSISWIGYAEYGYLRRASDGTWSLEDVVNYFELSDVDGKTYVKVKDQYAGLYANGSISALGLSGTSGGSGGGASELNDLDDVTLSPTLSGDDVFMYINGIWTNVPKSTLLSGYALATSIPTDTNDLTNGAGFVTSQYVSSNYQPLDSDLTGIAGLTGNGFLKRAANGTWSLENIDYFELSTVDGKTYVKVKDEYAGLYANGSISALGLSSASGGGGAAELGDLNDVTIASASSNDFLVYSNGEWRNMSKSAVLAGYVTTSDISGFATETYVNQRFEQLIGAAPEALDTLEEIASALQDSEDTVAGIVTSIASKADKTELLKTITVKTGYKTTITCTVDGTTVALPDYPDSLTDLSNDLSYLRIYNGSEMLVQYRGESSASLNLANYIPDVPTKTSELENDSGFYVLPSGGIPKSDLASGVQSSLGLADTAYQKPTGGIPKSDLASAVQTSLGKADTALQSYTETDPTVPAWAKASSLAFNSLPNLYIGKTAVQSSAVAQDLVGLGDVTPDETEANKLGSSSLRWASVYSENIIVDEIYLGSTSRPRMYWDSTNNCWHLTGNFVADGWISAMGINSNN